MSEGTSMEAKRIRLERNLPSSHTQTLLDLKIWQNIQISRAIDENYVNRLLETTRAVISHQSSDEANFVQQQQQQLEREAINHAITSYGLKKQRIFSDDESSSDSELPLNISSSSSSSSSPNEGHSSTFDDSAVLSAISSYGLKKGFGN